MTDILKYSLNTGVNFILNQMGGGENNLAGREKLYDYFTTHYLFGKKTGVEQAGEVAGYVQKPDTPHGAKVVYANMVFGQGIQTTPIQVASAFSAAVNGGKYWKPHLVAGAYDDGKFTATESELVRDGVLSEFNSQQLKEMLYDARFGFSGGVYDNGFYVGGKSGTAQIYDPETKTYSKNDYVGTYIGYGADAKKTPKYVIMVRVDDSHAGGFAGSVAAMPIFNDISNYLINYLGVSK
jgi:cell division protein FtsI/penicillin-binding protein 2